MIDVLVVGAGPSGLTLASELIRHGLTCRVIDKLAEPVTYSKAAVVHARTMEVFDAMELAHLVEMNSRQLHGLNFFSGGKRIAHVGFSGVDSPYPGVYGISQRDTERILTERLVKLGVVIERGVELASFTQDDAGIHAQTSRGAAIDARYIVGCDGAHSTVREALGVSFDGAPYEEKLIQADVRIAWSRELPDDEIVAFIGDDEQLALFPLFADGRYRMIVIKFGDAHDPDPKLEQFQAALDRHVPGATVSDPAWITSFRIHHRHANRLRDRRAFIAGDAGHIHSPAGGQGMNTGIQDAANLAWKLALVVRGKARPIVLDSYEAERLPIARELIAGTDAATRQLERMVSFRHPVATAVRDRLLGFATSLQIVQASVQRRLSMLEIGYPDSPIVAQDRPSVLASRVGGEGEAPTLRDWAAFGDGPAPGERVFPLPFLRGPRHTALLFDGLPTDAGYANLAEVGRAITSRTSEIDVIIVMPRGDRPAALDCDGVVVFDADGSLHKRFGARSECLYLIRPDGYVAYRTQPADGPQLLAYVDRVFT